MDGIRRKHSLLRKPPDFDNIRRRKPKKPHFGALHIALEDRQKDESVNRRFSPGSFAAAVLLGTALFALAGRTGGRPLSDFAFCLGSGALIIGLLRMLSNLRAFASFSWGMRFFKRLFRNEARSGRTETEDYARYRSSLGGNRDAPLLLALAVLLFALSWLTAR